MKIAIYATTGIHFDDILDEIVTHLPPDADMHLVRTIIELERQLRECQLSDMVILLVPEPGSDLPALYRLQELLRGVRLVILLPQDCSTELLNCAHSLFPRFLCFQPHGMVHLGRVVQNLCPAGTTENRLTGHYGCLADRSN